METQSEVERRLFASEVFVYLGFGWNGAHSDDHDDDDDRMDQNSRPLPHNRHFRHVQ